MRTAGLAERLRTLGYAVTDHGDIAIPASTQDAIGGPGRPKNVPAIREVNRAVAEAVAETMGRGAFPVLLGGDHSLAIGAIAGIARVKGPQGVIWIDAHPDLNTPETSPTGNLHGMAMAAALGAMADIFAPPEFPTPAAEVTRSVFIAVRDVDPGERRMIGERNIHCFTMSDIDRLGMGQIIERAIEIAGQGPGSVHISFDIDSLDPVFAPGTGTPVRGGITYREAHLAMELIAQSGVAHSLELVEVNPLLDQHNMTAKLASELICSALGKSIL